MYVESMTKWIGTLVDSVPSGAGKHAPLLQPPPRQSWPHFPQLLAEPRFVSHPEASSQSAYGAWQPRTQPPSTHAARVRAPIGHACPHAPQLSTECMRSASQSVDASSLGSSAIAASSGPPVRPVVKRH